MVMSIFSRKRWKKRPPPTNARSTRRFTRWTWRRENSTRLCYGIGDDVETEELPQRREGTGSFSVHSGADGEPLLGRHGGGGAQSRAAAGGRDARSRPEGHCRRARILRRA